METKSSYLINAGDIFLVDSQFKEASICYLKALSFNPSNELLLRIYNNLGICYKRMGRLEDAEIILRKGLATEPNHHSFYSNLASLYRIKNDQQKAIENLLKAVSLGSKMGDYLVLSELYKKQKQYKQALDIALLTVQKFPNEYEAYLNLGNIFAFLKSYDNARNPYLKAIELAPEKTQAYNNIGVAYKELGENENALSAYQKVLQLNPNDPAVHNNLGNLMRNMDDMQSAIYHLELSIKLSPNYADAYSNLGAVYKESKNYKKAVIYYHKALEINPNHTNANFDLSLIELSNGDYERGWKRYEHRLKMAELLAKTQVYHKPIWRGESLIEKIVILQNEQGFGDNIMFVRYAAQLAELGAKVIIRTRLQLVELFQSVKGVFSVINEDDTIPEYDFYLPLLSCPQRFQTKLSSIPNQFPYLSTDCKTPILVDKKKFNIGLSWSGSHTNKGHKDRYIGLKALSELFELKGIAWYSLQVGDDSGQIEKLKLKNKVIDKTELFTDFSQTAAFINELDLVITGDTSIAHLCGALKKEAFVLLSQPAEWRWLQKGTSSPWYDESLILVRQEARGDWSTPILYIKEELKKHTKAYMKK